MNVIEATESKLSDLRSRIESIEFKGGADNPFAKRLKVQYFKFKSSLNTYKELGDLQKENAKQNGLLPSFDIKDLHFKWRNKISIVVGFGPSLSGSVEHLLKIKDKYKTIACDKSMSWLYGRGIVADVYTTLDASVPADWIPDDIDLSGKVLIAHVASSHEYVKKFILNGGTVAFYVHFCMIGSHYELSELSGIVNGLPVSGNVGHASVVISSDVYASKKCLLIGYDNSWGCYYYPDKQTIGNESKRPIIVDDINGQKVTTDAQFMGYNQYLKEFINQRSFHDKVINCSGAGILNIKQDNFEKY